MGLMGFKGKMVIFATCLLKGPKPIILIISHKSNFEEREESEAEREQGEGEGEAGQARRISRRSARPIFEILAYSGASHRSPR